MGVGKASERASQSWTQPGVKERMSWGRERKMTPVTRDDWKVKQLAWEQCVGNGRRTSRAGL